MPLTARLSVVSQRIVDLIQASLVNNEDFFRPAVQDVYYGDQVKIPRSPSICVDPRQKTRTWPPQPSLMSEILFEVDLFIYHARVDGTQTVKLECDQLSEAIEEWLNINHLNLAAADGNQLIIHGHVVENESGVSYKSGSLFHANRLLWRAISKTRLTEAV